MQQEEHRVGTVEVLLIEQVEIEGMRGIAFVFFFFFQAEDGIRDRDVTGVQTCALPILTGSEESIEAATRAANFRFRYDAKSKLFAHTSGVMILTPGGRISRYFYGVEYPGRDMRLGLVDASAGKIGSPIDHVLLFCYHYDPSSAKYSASILRIIRLGGILTILLLIGGIWISRRRDLRAARSNLQGAH